MQSLLPETPSVLLPAAPAADAALAKAASVKSDGWKGVQSVAAEFPAHSAAWAWLAEGALTEGDPVAAYAYARTGYHRGLDQLRRSGWRGHGPIPWAHEPNRGFLRSVYALSRSAEAIGETEEAARCLQLLRDSDPAALDGLTAR